MPFHLGWRPTTHKGRKPFPRSVYAPPTVVRIVEVSSRLQDLLNVGQLEVLGEVIFSHYNGILHGWIEGQRANAQISEIKQYNATLTEPGLGAVYSDNQGTETLTLVAYPENVPGLVQSVLPLHPQPLPQAEQNLDGYILWTIAVPSSVGGPPAKFDIRMNGYLLLSGLSVDLTQPSGLTVVVMFGPTALRCQSLQDPPYFKPSNNPLALPANGGLVSQVLPPQGDWKASTAPDGTSIGPFQKEFGYYMFNDWSDVRNPAQYIYVGDIGGGAPQYTSWNAYLGDVVPPVQVTKGIWFTNTSKSPLNPTGPNYLAVTQSPDSASLQEAPNVNALYAEFYDRKLARSVTQTWDRSASTGGRFVANDTPAQWVVTSTNAFPAPYTGPVIGIDLTPGATTASMGGDNALYTIPGGVQGSGSGSAFTADQQAALSSYAAAYSDVILAFETTMGPILSADDTMHSDVLAMSAPANTVSSDADSGYGVGTLQANACDAVLSTTITLTSYVSVLSSIVVGLSPVEYGVDTASITNAISTAVNNAETAYDNVASAYSNAVAVISAALPSFLRTQVLNDLSTFDSVATTAYSSISALASAVGTLTIPNLPLRPQVGNSISPFSYKLVSVSGDDWSFS